MSACDAEMCANWTGDGCACAVFGLEPTCGACGCGVHEHCERVTRRGLMCCCHDEDADR